MMLNQQTQQLIGVSPLQNACLPQPLMQAQINLNPEDNQRALLAHPNQDQNTDPTNQHSNVPQIIEEKIINANGEETIIRYLKGRFLGKVIYQFIINTNIKQGGFAKCYELRYAEPQNTQQKNRIFAVKVVPKASLTRTKARQKLTSEIKIHKSLCNEFVVQFDRYFEDKENVYILLDICQNQSLNELVRRRKRLTELEAQCYLMQLIKATDYLHKFKVIHRDLKLGNLFLSERMQLKVGDFGLAAKVVFDGEKKRTICGTPNYIAPEILDSKLGHSYEVDYWSIGVILYTLLVGRPPFESPEVKQTYKKIKANQYQFPEGVPMSDQAKDFIRQLLKTEPSQRMTLKEMYAHDFLNMNKIPEFLPISTLVCPPSNTFIKQYLGVALPAEKSPSDYNQNTVLQNFQQIQTARTPTNIGLASGSQSQRRLNDGKETQRYIGHDLNDGLLATTRDVVGISAYQTLQEDCKTQRELIRNPTYNIIQTQQQNYMQGSVSQSPRGGISDFQFGKTSRIDQSNNNGLVSGRPSTSPYQKDSNIYQTGITSGMSQTPRNLNTDKRMSNIIQNNNYKTEQQPNYSPVPNFNQTVTNPMKRNMEKENNYMTQTIDENLNLHTQLRTTRDYINNQKQEPQNEPVAKIELTNAAHFPIESLVYSDKLQQRTELIVQYVDFSTKYGMGYKLSNGQYGVLFNDSTKILLDANLFHFDYVQRNPNGQDDDVQSLNFFNYPKAINKKVILLQHFKSYLDGNQKFKPLEFKFDPQNPPAKLNLSQPSYLKKWKRAKKAILFRLSNKIIQVIFQDQSELILCSGNGIVTFISSKKQIKKLPLSSDLESKDPSMYKRLQYAKEILIQMINKNETKSSSKIDKNLYSATTTLTTDRQTKTMLESTQQPSALINSLSQNLRANDFQNLQSHRTTHLAPINPTAELISLKHFVNPSRDLQTERNYNQEDLSSTLSKQRTVEYKPSTKDNQPTYIPKNSHQNYQTQNQPYQRAVFNGGNTINFNVSTNSVNQQQLHQAQTYRKQTFQNQNHGGISGGFTNLNYNTVTSHKNQLSAGSGNNQNMQFKYQVKQTQH
eukprot:403351315